MTTGKKAVAETVAYLLAIFGVFFTPGSSTQVPQSPTTPTNARLTSVPTQTPVLNPLRPTGAGGISVSCGDISCVGFQLDCSLQLTDACVDFREDDVKFFVVAEGTRSPATFTSRDVVSSMVTFTVHYTPIVPQSRVQVEIEFLANASEACTFEGSAVTTIIGCPSQHTLAVDSTWGQTHPLVQGCDTLTALLSMHATRFSIVSLTLAVDLHPALRLVNSSYSTDQTTVDVATAGVTQPPFLTQADIQSRSSPILALTFLELGSPFFVNLTFQVELYALPNASIYATFYVWYIATESERTRLNLRVVNLDMLYTPAPSVGQPVIELVSYPQNVGINDTLPPEQNELFYIKVPLTFPRISTNMDLVVQLPDFSFLNYSIEFIGEEGVSLTGLDNFFCLPSLCNYTMSGTQPKLCTQTGISPLTFAVVLGYPHENKSEVYDSLDYFPYASGSESDNDGDLEGMNDTTNQRTILIRFPPLLYGGSCRDADQTIEILLYGRVTEGLTSFACGMEAFSNYLTINLIHTEEQSTSTSIYEPLQTAETNTEDDYIVFTGVPYMDLLISSSTNGIATKQFGITFTGRHNPLNSRLIPSSISYMFSVDDNLSIASNGTLCISSTVGPAMECSEVVFLGNNISGELDRYSNYYAHNYSAYIMKFQFMIYVHVM